MKSALLLFSSLLVAPAFAAENPAVKQVVMLLTELRAKVELEGEIEQKSYDKYACWCEDTLSRKSKDISAAKELIVELENLMVQLKADIAAHAAEIEQLKKDVKGNLESQREATETRENEYNGYEKEKIESEQCIRALEAAIKVLTGAGTGKKGFLETLQEAQLLSVVSGVRGVIDRLAKKVADPDLQVVRDFVERPEDFVSGRSDLLSAAQIKHNPFGDYAPQSTQIQGILKSMYDSFVADLEKDNADESDSQKSYTEFMNTKKQELATLELTLQTQNKDKADKTTKLADTKLLSDDTKMQLDADGKFFEETKAACETQAKAWSERVRLRTEELQALGKAIEVLGSPESAAIFHNSSTTFVQLSLVRRHREDGAANQAQNQAFEKLKLLASSFRNTQIGRLALVVKRGVNFDKMIAVIDNMIAVLRKEEQEDIEHRDRCQGAQQRNQNDEADAKNDIKKANSTINRLQDDEDSEQGKIDKLRQEIAEAGKEKDDLLRMRNIERSEFEQALADDAAAAELVEQAIQHLTKFYTDNKLPLALLAKKANEDPTYKDDPDVAPDLVYAGKSYTGKSSETGGIVAILGMIREDILREMKVARRVEEQAQEDYVKQDAALTEVMNSDIAAKLATLKELLEVQKQISDLEKLMNQKEADKSAEEELANAIENDCAWVASHFESRRDARKAEIAGLQEAKGYLAGVQDGSDLTMEES